MAASATTATCPMCGSASVTITATKEEDGQRWSLARCGKCGLHFTDPQPTPDYLAKRYSGDYHQDLRVPGGTEKAFGAKYQRYADWLVPHLKPGARVLDIGCATGGLVKLLRDRGFAAEGLELNPETAAWGSRHYDITIHNETLEACGFAPASFDAAILTDVLEHTLHPRDYLANVGRLLSRDGTVLVTFPDIRSIESRYYRTLAKLSGRPWLWRNLHIPLHIWEFTRPTAEACFRSAGFDVIAFRRDQVIEEPEKSALMRLVSLPSRVLGVRGVARLLGTQMEFILRKR